MTSKPSDERRTPRWFFEACSRLWGPFDLDCFAAPWNHQVDRYCTKERSFYAWTGRAGRGWVQPPYSRGQLDKALAYVRALVLERRLQGASCLIPMDPSTGWWEHHVARPEGRRHAARWLELPKPFTNDAHQLISTHLAVTIAKVNQRLSFDEPEPWSHRDTGAKQPSVVVTFERPRAGR